MTAPSNSEHRQVHYITHPQTWSTVMTVKTAKSNTPEEVYSKLGMRFNGQRADITIKLPKAVPKYLNLPGHPFAKIK